MSAIAVKYVVVQYEEIVFLQVEVSATADPSSRRVAPSVVCLSAISKLYQSDDLGPNRAVARQKMKKYKVMLL
jgi:hypothetical protein